MCGFDFEAQTARRWNEPPARKKSFLCPLYMPQFPSTKTLSARVFEEQQTVQQPVRIHNHSIPTIQSIHPPFNNIYSSNQSNKQMNGFIFALLLLLSFSSSGIACISYGGCLLGYPNGGCAPATGYFAHCYGGYCRKSKAKGSRMLALNESDGGLGGRGAEEGHKRMNEFGRIGGGGRTLEENPSRKDEEGKDFTPLEVSPDVLFLECCQSWSLPRSCLLKCSYTNYTAEMLRSMFFRSDECPIESASIIHFCASQNLDHSLCCRQNGILTTRSGEKCMIFCEQLPQNETRLDLSYVSCFERFTEMKKCFYESALRTIDYLEAEFDQLKKGDEAGHNKLKDEAGGGEGKQRTSADQDEAGAQEDEEERGSTFSIAKPPVIFVNDRSIKHPNINDDYTPAEEEAPRGKRREGAAGHKGKGAERMREGRA
ncbi:hypothetical protein GPALN_005431 [Globodera pallida]|nr:hypothetical protein GPALN_005431 [Globodera pallida]